MHKQIFFSTLFLCLFLCGVNTFAQGTLFDVSLGHSRSDRYFGSAALHHAFGARFRAGVSVFSGEYRYRFIDARKVSDANVTIVEIPLTYCIYNQGKLRADLALKTGLRFMQAPETPEFLHEFKNSTALTLDPGLLVTVVFSKRFSLQSGVLLPVVYQLRPVVLEEQIQSGVLQLGGTWKINKQLTFFAKSPFGPSYGAGGDAEKFFWSASAGLRWNIGAKASNAHVLNP
ncbi:MAG: hypothetical protein R3D00_12030 [Bacteroidia bacterium]